MRSLRMGFIDWLKRPWHRHCPRAPIQRAHRFMVPRLEQLESRVTPDITLTNAFLVDSHDHAVAAPDKGEMAFIQANWTTQGLPADASYRISYNVDGVDLYSSTVTFGAGHTQTESWYWYRGGWFAAPGTHNVTVTIDPT